MIGVILCGHGNFATGMYSALKLIAGEQENFSVIDFIEGMGSHELEVKLQEALLFVNTGDGVVIFTDIPGGTPFNQAGLLIAKNESAKLIAGTNLPLLLDSCFKRQMKLSDFVNEVIQIGKSGVQEFKLKQPQEISNDSDGI
ncbi:PTS galactosamine/N-acetylgalactosamine transporter subunit IIA [Carnobacterium gallinarum]|uniref:PTS galactosamine/N-acetylgalactosamine transporter subunit IIA n=1 Tax=Carnobacterium gallinarum TaxID=2749 RepID=UPI00055250CB|nr:PTS galactosamine/N-acetylgalactosamine transporter subunit IIA [Carnobacterium gallinarum]